MLIHIPFHLPPSLDIECHLRPGPFVTIRGRITHFINANLDVWSPSPARSPSVALSLKKKKDLYTVAAALMDVGFKC